MEGSAHPVVPRMPIRLPALRRDRDLDRESRPWCRREKSEPEQRTLAVLGDIPRPRVFADQ